MGFRNMGKAYLGVLPTLNLEKYNLGNFYTNTNEGSERSVVKL